MGSRLLAGPTPTLSPECGLSLAAVCPPSPTLALSSAPQSPLKGQQPQAGSRGGRAGRGAGPCRCPCPELGARLLPGWPALPEASQPVHTGALGPDSTCQLLHFTCDAGALQTAVTLCHPKASPLLERFTARVWGQCLRLSSRAGPHAWDADHKGQLGLRWPSEAVSCVPFLRSPLRRGPCPRALVLPLCSSPPMHGV